MIPITLFVLGLVFFILSMEKPDPPSGDWEWFKSIIFAGFAFIFLVVSAPLSASMTSAPVSHILDNGDIATVEPAMPGTGPLYLLPLFMSVIAVVWLMILGLQFMAVRAETRRLKQGIHG